MEKEDPAAQTQLNRWALSAAANLDTAAMAPVRSEPSGERLISDWIGSLPDPQHS